MNLAQVAWAVRVFVRRFARIDDRAGCHGSLWPVPPAQRAPGCSHASGRGERCPGYPPCLLHTECHFHDGRAVRQLRCAGKRRIRPRSPPEASPMARCRWALRRDLHSRSAAPSVWHSFRSRSPVHGGISLDRYWFASSVWRFLLLRWRRSALTTACRYRRGKYGRPTN